MTMALTVLALGLRVWGVDFGLPDTFHQDEPILIHHALALGVKGWNPGFFVLPPFCMYFLFGLFASGYAVLKLTGWIADPSAYAARFIQDPTLFYLGARLTLGCAFSAATVWVLARAAGRLHTPRVGWMAAALLAVAPLAVRHGHYAYTDSALTLAVTIFSAACLRWARGEGGTAAAVRAGAWLGWAVSIKYTAVYTVGLFVSAWLVREGKRALSPRSLAAPAGAAAASLAVFALIAPFTFLDWTEAVSQVRRQAGAEYHLPLTHHLRYSLISSCGPFLIAAALAGWIVLWRRRRGDAIVWASFALPFYLINTFFGQPFARYVLPALPAICWLAAVLWDAVWELRGRRWAAVLGAVLVVPMAVVSLISVVLFAREDTRTLCRRWFETHGPASSVVVLDSRAYGPRLPQDAAQLRDKFAVLEAGDNARRKRLELAVERALEHPGYRLYVLTDGPPQPGRFLLEGPYVQADASAVQALAPDYLVVNRFELRAPVEALISSLGDSIEKIQTFSPYRDGRRRTGLDPHASTAAPEDWRELWVRERLGPPLDVYRFRREAQS